MGDLTCEQDRSPTRLTCVQCAKPICPQCFVRTPVGLKCPVCGAGKGGHGEVRRKRAWVVPVGLALVLAVAIVLPRMSSDSETGQTAAEEEVPFAPNPEGPARFAGLTEEARDGNLAFIANAFECGPRQVGEGTVTRTAQGRYCFLTLTMRNTGRSPVQVFGPGQMLQDGQNRRFGADERATGAHPANAGFDPLNALINPSNELGMVLVFDVPADVEPTFAHLRASPRGRGAYIRLQPRS